MMSGLLKIMLPGLSNVLCRYLSMLCIYLACHHRKRFIVLFRLAHWLLALATIVDFTLPELSLGDGSAIQAKQLPGPLAIGSRDSPSLGYKQAPRPVQDLLAGKRGPALRALWVARQQPLDLWNQPTSHVAVEQKKKHRDRLFKRKYI